MNKEQMQMLSVKSAIERMVQNYINAFQANGTPKQFFDAVERMVASFFVGQQIENNFIVRAGAQGDLEISFTAHKHCSRITFMLPETLLWKIEKLQGTNHNEFLTRDLRKFNAPNVVPFVAPRNGEFVAPRCGNIVVNPTTGIAFMFDGTEWKEVPNCTVSPEVQADMAVDVTVNEKEFLQEFLQEYPVDDSNFKTPDVFDPIKAYERAKKADRNMS